MGDRLKKFTIEQSAGVQTRALAEAALKAGLEIARNQLLVGIASHKNPGGQVVSLVPAQTNVGGHRWWFECPECDRRVNALYVPPNGHELACRHCHNLTYQSVQRHDQRVDWLRRHPEALERLLDVPHLPLRYIMLTLRATDLGVLGSRRHLPASVVTSES